MNSHTDEEMLKELKDLEEEESKLDREIERL
jgi:hypothetical protein